jgi:hypothetical protein
MDKIYTYDVCKLCGEADVLPSHFWREHHIKEADYAWTYLPKRSKLTGNLIRFKNREFYYTSDFNDKNELKKWIKENPAEALEYSLGLIKDRFDQGKITYIPTQVELRSLCSPNVIWYETHCDYNRECQEIGLRPRFKYKVNALRYGVKPLNITIDTREQKALSFRKTDQILITKLEYGDYWASNSEWNHVYVERKNLSDFIGTLSMGYDRFEREIVRAQKDNNYLVILVEESINNALGFNMLPHISKNIKASPDYIFHKVRRLTQEYPNIQFVFADGRAKATDIILKIYSMQEDPSLLDLQFLIDKKIL